MIKEAIDRILSLAPLEPMQIDGRDYCDRPPIAVMEPIFEKFAVTSLASFVDLTKACRKLGGFDATDEDCVVNVAGHDSVLFARLQVDDWGRRVVMVGAKPPESQQFRFGQWYDQETFIIALQSLFALGGDLDYVLNLANNITTGKVTTSEDDGVTQRVTVKKGAALKEVKEMKRRVSLAPYRTFREVEQPASEFVFRVKQVEDEIPALALFEADGGKWKLDAAAAVRTWLGERLPGYLIVA